jgi:hypothetical protein
MWMQMIDAADFPFQLPGVGYDGNLFAVIKWFNDYRKLRASSL